MKVLLMGAGGQGGPCASILAHDKDVQEITLADYDIALAKKVHDKTKSDKIKVAKVDAASVDDVAKLAEGHDVIIDLVTPKFYFEIMKAAVKAGVHYVNTAFDRTLWDNKIELGKKPHLFDDFVQNGKSALLGCGMSSGYTNVIVRHYIDKLDTPKSVRVRLAKKDLSIGKYGDAINAWNPGWDPRQALLDFKLQQTKFENGQYVFRDEPFSEIEEWDFPEPFGKMAVSMHAHEEPYSIPLSFADKGLEYCDFKYYVNMQIAPVIALGLACEEPIDVDGKEIIPLHVVLSRVPKAAEGFLTEDPSKFDFQDKNKLVSIMVEVRGIKDGKEKTYLIAIPTMNAPRQKMYECFGTSYISVALPAVVGAKMLGMSNQPKGVIFPHDMDSDVFLKTMENMGYKHSFYEVI